MASRRQCRTVFPSPRRHPPEDPSGLVRTPPGPGAGTPARTRLEPMTDQQPQQPNQPPQQSGVAGTTDDGRVYVVTPTAMAVEGPPESDRGSDSDSDSASDSDQEQGRSVTDMVSQPDKVMRIGNMIRQLLDEVKAAPLDEA